MFILFSKLIITVMLFYLLKFFIWYKLLFLCTYFQLALEDIVLFQGFHILGVFNYNRYNIETFDLKESFKQLKLLLDIFTRLTFPVTQMKMSHLSKRSEVSFSSKMKPLKTKDWYESIDVVKELYLFVCKTVLLQP